MQHEMNSTHYAGTYCASSMQHIGHQAQPLFYNPDYAVCNQPPPWAMPYCHPPSQAYGYPSSPWTTPCGNGPPQAYPQHAYGYPAHLCLLPYPHQVTSPCHPMPTCQATATVSSNLAADVTCDSVAPFIVHTEQLEQQRQINHGLQKSQSSTCHSLQSGRMQESSAIDSALPVHALPLSQTASRQYNETLITCNEKTPPARIEQQQPSLILFDGSGEWESHLKQVEMVALELGWEEDETLDFMLEGMRLKANDFVSTLDNASVENYKVFLGKMSSKFGKRHESENDDGTSILGFCRSQESVGQKSIHLTAPTPAARVEIRYDGDVKGVPLSTVAEVTPRTEVPSSGTFKNLQHADQQTGTINSRSITIDQEQRGSTTGGSLGIVQDVGRLQFSVHHTMTTRPTRVLQDAEKPKTEDSCANHLQASHAQTDRPAIYWEGTPQHSEWPQSHTYASFGAQHPQVSNLQCHSLPGTLQNTERLQCGATKAAWHSLSLTSVFNKDHYKVCHNTVLSGTCTGSVGVLQDGERLKSASNETSRFLHGRQSCVQAPPDHCDGSVGVLQDTERLKSRHMYRTIWNNHLQLSTATGIQPVISTGSNTNTPEVPSNLNSSHGIFLVVSGPDPDVFSSSSNSFLQNSKLLTILHEAIKSNCTITDAQNRRSHITISSVGVPQDVERQFCNRCYRVLQ